MRILRYLCFLLLANLLGTLVAHADVVAVLNSERATSYTSVVDSLRGTLQVPPGVSSMPLAYATDGDAMQLLLSKSPRVVVGLGAAALRTLLATDMRIPIVASLIPRSTFDKVMREPGRKATGPVYGLFLDQPFSRQLDLVHLVQPDVRQIGVIWGPDSAALRPQLQAALAARGWSEVAGVVGGGGASLGEATKRALEGSNALLAVADPAVFNSATVSNVLLASYRAKLGVYGFSPSYVKAGALVGVYSTPAQIGAHTADTVRSLLRGAAVPSGQYPAEFTVSVNEHVARSLGLSLDEASLTERLKRMERKP
jgi:putative ABC transport system substrate-binding protein